MVSLISGFYLRLSLPVQPVTIHSRRELRVIDRLLYTLSQVPGPIYFLLHMILENAVEMQKLQFLSGLGPTDCHRKTEVGLFRMDG